MKAIIWIIVALLVIWGLWSWLGGGSETNVVGNDNYSAVTASSTNVQEDLDISVDSKG